MLESLRIDIVWGLLAATVVISIGEFYGGKELRRSTKETLEHWWLQLSYVRLPGIGLAEARFTEAMFRRLVGVYQARLLLTAVMVGAGSIVLAIREISTATPGWAYTLRMLDGAWSQIVLFFWPGLVGGALISLEITYGITRRSITWCANRRYSTMYFLVALALGAAVSEVLLFIVKWFTSYRFRSLDMGSWLLPSFLEIRPADAVGLYAMYIESHILFWFRIGLACAFTVWLFSGYVLRWISATIYELYEAEKGALTVFSAILTGAAAGIKWWISEMV